MSTTTAGYRLVRRHRHPPRRPGHQQDQVQIIPHQRVPGSVMAVLADGMGGKSGGRKAADQVILTAQQIFERFAPTRTTPPRRSQLVLEAHLMIKLTAITSEEEPHSTVAAFIISPSRECHYARRRFARLPLPRPRDGGAHGRPLLRAAARRRRGLDHRGRGEQPPAVQPADRLPGHAPGSADHHRPHRPARGRRQRAGLQRRSVALLPAARAGRHRAACRRAARRDAGQQGAPARAAAAATTCRWR